MIRLYANTGARLSEVGNLLMADVDMTTESVHFHGKGAKDRRVRFGPKTARALSRHLRARDNRRGAALPNLWLAERGGAPLPPNGIKILTRLGRAAGVADLHAHRWRHSFAHEWKLAGADTGDLVLLLGWASEDMPRRYGASAAAGPARRRGRYLANLAAVQRSAAGSIADVDADGGGQTWCGYLSGKINGYATTLAPLDSRKVSKLSLAASPRSSRLNSTRPPSCTPILAVGTSSTGSGAARWRRLTGNWRVREIRCSMWRYCPIGN